MKSGKLQGSIFKIKILAFAGILLLIWCGYRLIKTGLEEQQDYEFLAVSEEQEIPQEFLEELGFIHSQTGAHKGCPAGCSQF